MGGRQILGKARRHAERLVGTLARSVRTEHLFGPRTVTLRDDDVMVTALVKNAAYFIATFIDHHIQLGVRHILFIDNGSTDASVEIAKRFPCVTIVRNTLPAFRHEAHLRSEISRRVARGGWVMFADADELADIPLPGQTGLAGLVGHCNRSGYTAVVGQMLDHFSDEPYHRLRGLDYKEAISSLRLYSLAAVESIDYDNRAEIPFSYFLERNSCPDRGVQLKRGGVRRELFGENPFLSKHSLVRNLPETTLMTHPHCASGVRVADVTLLLRHYKLAGDWVERDAHSVRTNVWRHGEDRLRLAAVGTGDFRLTSAQPRTWASVDTLLDEGFLYASSAFSSA